MRLAGRVLASPSIPRGGRASTRSPSRPTAPPGERRHSEAFFVVRPEPAAAAPAILVLATNTYNAYNQWGGACLYSGATQVSFARPIERGYVRRPAAPFETDYDGRVASIEPEGEVEHARFQRYLADNDYPLWCASVGLALLGAALRALGRGDRASRSTTR